MESTNYVNLCLVKTKNNDIVPVVVPHGTSLNTGDIVFVRTNISEQPADVIFSRPYTMVDDDFWTAMILVTGMAPLRIKKYAYVYEAKWEDEEKNE